MGFKSLDTSDKHFKVVKLHLLNEKGFTSNYCILDFDKATPYYFMCPVCKKNSTNIGHDKLNSFDSKKFKIDFNAILSLGGPGSMCKLIQCTHCDTHYFVGIGYIEPNNGRSVLLIHNII